MTNKINRLLLLLSVSLLLPVSALAAETWGLDDDAKLFNSTEAAAIKRELQQIRSESGANVLVVTSTSESDGNTGELRSTWRWTRANGTDVLLMVFGGNPENKSIEPTAGIAARDTTGRTIKQGDKTTIAREIMKPLVIERKYAQAILAALKYVAPAMRGEDISEELSKVYASKLVGKPATDKPVVDYANIFSDKELREMTDSLLALDRFNGTQVVVVTVKSLADMTVEDYAQRLFDNWKIGDKKLNNGVLILVKEKNSEGKGQVRIHTGYGAEGALPDAFCKRIIEEEMIPEFKENDYGKGVLKAIKVIAPVMRGEYSEAAYIKKQKTKEAWSGEATYLIVGGLFYIVVFFMCVRRQENGHTIWSDPAIGGSSGGGHRSSGGSSWSSSSGGSSWSSGGGGGYSYGGGSSGGGGASGSW